MKILIILLFSLNVVSVFAQTTTYSEEEERMVQYVNNGFAYALKYDSLQNFKLIIDSCWKFLDKYPNSFAKPNVFSYLIEMTAVITNDLQKVNPLIDSVLYYDNLPITKQRIGAILIERNFDLKRGREFIFDALPNLTVPYHLYNSYMLLAKSDITLGKYASAISNFENALKVDSTRAEAWYEYLGFLRIREMSGEANVVLAKINKLEEQAKLRFTNQTSISPNINKNILEITVKDLDSNSVKLNSLEGEIVVINRFNFWCSPCIKEFAMFKKLIRVFPDVKFIFLNSGETSSELRERYFEKKEFNFLKTQPVYFVTDEYFNQIYGYGVPHTLVVDKNGNVRYDYLGYRKELETLLINNLRSLLVE
jgi:thiol-disulfide isomerase/thioredoxin